MKEFFLDTLNKHAPLKKKSVRANHAPYVTKTLRKAIMRGSNLQTIYFKRTTVVSYIKKNARCFLATLIQAIFVRIKHFGSTFSWVFFSKEKFQIKKL